MKQLQGTGVALATPFDREKNIDYNGLERLISHCIEGGVEYLVVMGTTAENPTLSPAEKTKVLRAAVEAAQNRVPIVYGLGGNNTAALVQQIREDDLRGVTALLSVSPYYNKPTQEGIFQHFKTLSEASPLPLILYNVPGRTGSNMTAETTLRLAHGFENIIGIKEASGDIEQVMQIVQDRPEDFLVISGEDNLTLPLLACGGDGVISVSGQAFPSVMSEMVRQGLQNDFDKARKLHYRLYEVTKLLFAEGNPGGVKTALDLMDVCQAHLRQPLWPVSQPLRQKIQQQIDVHQL
jgi:4-hydroxy-tetrahydrodipicolinate synthase